jgi:DNA mismatch endonuclease (patch repair protein)
MADVVDKATRSRMMAGIRGRDTRPELLVRRFLHATGLRFRLQSKLPGKPDLLFPKYQAAVFVHGCFWHRHANCRYAATPSSNRKFWLDKFEENTRRDRTARRLLRKLGWRPIVIWECQLVERHLDSLHQKIVN